MSAIARDLHLSLRVFAALAAVFIVLSYGAPAGRMRTFLLLDISHYNSTFPSKSSRRIEESRRWEGFGSIPAISLRGFLALDATSCPWHGCEAFRADRRFAVQACPKAA
jgi:hypothetical protein